MSVGIADHREITHDAAGIDRRLDQRALLSCCFGNAIDFSARVALKAEVIETRLYFILHNYQNEDWIYSGFGWRPEPDIVPPFKPAITHNR